MSSGAVSGVPVELWLARLDALADPLADLERHDPVCASGDLDGLDGARRTARLLLRRILARHFGRAVARLPFERRSNGKPAIPGLNGDFNLAHTTGAEGAFALIGVGSVTLLGVDLELPRTVRLDARRRALIIDAALRVGCGAALLGDEDGRILQAWVRLEAWGKADGRGIGRTLSHFGVWGGSDRTPVVSGAVQAGLDSRTVYDLAVGAGLNAAVALPLGVASPPVRDVPADPAALATLFSIAAESANSGVDLAPGAGHKVPHRSVAQPG
jgi:hypothetical protein